MLDFALLRVDQFRVVRQTFTRRWKAKKLLKKLKAKKQRMLAIQMAKSDEERRRPRTGGAAGTGAGGRGRAPGARGCRTSQAPAGMRGRGGAPEDRGTRARRGSNTPPHAHNPRSAHLDSTRCMAGPYFGADVFRLILFTLLGIRRGGGRAPEQYPGRAQRQQYAAANLVSRNRKMIRPQAPADTAIIWLWRHRLAQQRAAQARSRALPRSARRPERRPSGSAAPLSASPPLYVVDFQTLLWFNK